MIFASLRKVVLEIGADFKALSWNSNNVFVSLRASGACILALLTVWALNMSNPAWAGLTAFLVVQSSRGATLVQTFERIFTTIIGVCIALLLLRLLGDMPIILLLVSIIGLTICFYFSAKSPTPFVWIYGPITFLLVLFSSHHETSQFIMHYAFSRAVEISIGALCGLCITLLFRAPLAMDNLQKNNLELLRSLKRLTHYCLDVYHTSSPPVIFASELKHLIQLAETQTTLLRFAKHESRFSPQGNDNDLQLEQLVFMAQEMLAHLYYENEGTDQEVVAQFREDIAHFQQVIDQSLDRMIAAVEAGSYKRSVVSKSLTVWGQTLEDLIKKTEVFRDEHGLKFSPQQWMKWYHFLVRQEEFFFLIRDFSVRKSNASRKLLRSKRLRQLFFWSAYHWEYAFKTALAGLLLPLIAFYFKLPGAVIMGIVVIIALQVNLHATRRKLLLLLVGSALGMCASLVLMSLHLTHMETYLCALGLLIFLIGTIVHGDPSRNMVGFFAAVIFLLNAASGMVSLQAWPNVVILFLEIAAAAFILQIFLVWIWPFSARSIFKYYHDQVAWYQGQIRRVLLQVVAQKHPQSVARVRQKFTALYQQIRAFEAFSWEGAACQQKMQEVLTLWYHSYHFLAALSLALQTVDLTDPKSPLKHFFQEVLTQEASQQRLQRAREEIIEYRRLLRERFIAGERLPFANAMRMMHTLNVLEKFSKCRQALIDDYAFMKI